MIPPAYFSWDARIHQLTSVELECFHPLNTAGDTRIRSLTSVERESHGILLPGVLSFRGQQSHIFTTSRPACHWGIPLCPSVNRKVAEWFRARTSNGGGPSQGARGRDTMAGNPVALAGTSMWCPTYSSDRFNLIVLNEFTCKPASLLHIDAIVIDSCIDISSSRQVIRDWYLITRIPHYFDEPNRSEPH